LQFAWNSACRTVFEGALNLHKCGAVALLRSKLAAIGTGLYLLAVACASIYPVLDRRTFSGIIVVLLALPWIDYLPSALLPLAIILNAVVIFGLLLLLSHVPSWLRRLQKHKQ
jgi:hypothetical protein